MPTKRKDQATNTSQPSDTQEVLTYHYAKGYLPTENPKHEEIHADGDRNP
ncbi:hypothetical protein [Tumebacillus permanentifrigoris]|uniref:Uncharacterized protein n=1 Tax=Tumebacillus permanentifrigoris TaxID=378543 RepID=A0A316D8F6_9BACL|nr:hypothetical protein [Tumebacillus permanentifrigoris]PWK06648.1 hypothetical protein C7459_11972 [Tumebacillus permanentifrigoris]